MKTNSLSNIFYPTAFLKVLFVGCLSFFTIHSSAQKKKPVPPPVVIAEPVSIISYEVLENGDTINKLDSKNRKVGMWLIVNKGGYGEADYMEWGNFDENIKTGVWKTYSMDGIISSEEFFKKGKKSGEAKYYDEGKLYCIGNYLALSSQYEYDTIMVEDPVTEREKAVIIKADVGSVRHGFWTYYNTSSQDVKRVVEYQADEVIYEKEYEAKVDSTYIKQRMKTFLKGEPSPNTMTLDKHKKPAKFTDFPENTQYVKPNVRQKPAPKK